MPRTGGSVGYRVVTPEVVSSTPIGLTLGVLKYTVKDISFSMLNTGGSVGWASGCHGGGREFDSVRTNTQGLKITEEKVLPL